MNPNHAHWLSKPPMRFALTGIVLRELGWLPGQFVYFVKCGRRPYLPLFPQAFGDLADLVGSVGSQAPEVMGAAAVK